MIFTKFNYKTVLQLKLNVLTFKNGMEIFEELGTSGYHRA